MIASLFGGIWTKLLAGGALAIGLIVAVWRIFAGIKASGRREQALEDANAGLQGRIKAQEKVSDARHEVDMLGSADDRLERLREHERRARGAGS